MKARRVARPSEAINKRSTPRIILKLEPLASTFERRGIRGESFTLVGHQVYIFGGRYSANVGMVFSVKSCSWEPSVYPLEARREHHTAALVDDKIYLHGGELGNFAYTDLLELDLLLGTARKIISPNGDRGRSGATALYVPWRREILFFGGMEYGGDHPRKNDILAFNVDSCAWKDTAPKGELPVPRSAHGAVLYGFNMYVFGGFGGGNVYLNDLWIADLTHHSRITWSQVPTHGATPMGRSLPCLNKLGRFLFLLGGNCATGSLKDKTHVFLPESREWVTVPGEVFGLEGELPNAYLYTPVEITGGILYFTSSNVSKLTLDG